MKATWPETPIDGRSFRRLEPLAIYDQLDYEPRAAIEARDEALARVESHSADFRTVAYDALRYVAAHQDRLTSEDVWRRLEAMGFSKPAEARAIGPVMKRGTREGLIAFVEYGHSSNPAHHRDVQAVYRSVR